MAIKTKSVFEKLGLKPGYHAAVINAPVGFKVPAVVLENPRLSPGFDLILYFAVNAADLRKRLPTLKKAIKSHGKVWIAWQKGKVSDLDRNGLWAIGEEVGFDSVATCSIDHRWSAMKLMYPKEQRP